MLEASFTYPLLWPVERPRTDSRQRSRFDTTNMQASREVLREVERITLLVKAVRVEGLASIRGADAVAEGLTPTLRNEPNAIERFAALWDSINAKKHPWASNPWVWVVEFERVKEAP